MWKKNNKMFWGGVNSLAEVRGVGFVDFYGKTVKFMYFGYS